MTYYKVVTHDRRSPIQRGDPLWTGRLPVTLPEVSVDISDVACGAGWNCVTDLAAGLSIAGLWPDGHPSLIIEVEPTGTVVTRGDKTRSPGMRLLRRVPESVVRAAVARLSEPFGEHAAVMVREQMAWRRALAHPKHDPETVEAALGRALESRGLGWQPRRYKDARAARAAWDAWDARAAWAALTWAYATLMGWVEGAPDKHTVGIRDAYRHGLAVAVPTGSDELGWAMEERT